LIVEGVNKSSEKKWKKNMIQATNDSVERKIFLN
jgi:hypothetical protein